VGTFNPPHRWRSVPYTALISRVAREKLPTLSRKKGLGTLVSLRPDELSKWYPLLVTLRQVKIPGELGWPPAARTLADDIKPIMDAAKSAIQAVEGVAQKVGPALEEGAEEIEEECAGGGCIPPL
jgi:hypothetical protein